MAIPKEAERLILSLVSGALEDVRDFRGFNLTLTSSTRYRPIRNRHCIDQSQSRQAVGAKEWMMVIYIIVTVFFVVIFMLGGFIVLRKYFAKPRPSRYPSDWLIFVMLRSDWLGEEALGRDPDQELERAFIISAPCPLESTLTTTMSTIRRRSRWNRRQLPATASL